MNEGSRLVNQEIISWDPTTAGSLFHSVLQGAGLGVWALDVTSGRLAACELSRSMFGRAPKDSFQYGDMLSCLHPKHRNRWHMSLAEAVQENKEISVELRVHAPFRRTRWIELRGRLNHASETSLIVSGVTLDITARKEAELYRAMVFGGMQHRTKNMFAMAQAIVGQSMRTAETVEEAQALATGRLQALASAQELLEEQGGNSAGFGDMVDHCLSPFRSNNIHTTGPFILIGPQAVTTLSLVLHELATNATKYGALSSAQGSVHVYWTIETADTPMFRFCWIETGGPEVAPSRRTGYGSRILDGLVRMEWEGDVKMDFRPQGLRYELFVPLERLCMQRGPL